MSTIQSRADTNLIGKGLYTVPEASRITGVPAETFRRWVFGYARRRNCARVEYAPLTAPEIGRIEGQCIVGFRDLLEARVVNAFREAGVSWHVIRQAARNTQTIDRPWHPFLSRRFRTDGRTIFLEIAKQSDEPKLIDLARNQLAFHSVIAPSLFKQIVFGDDDEPKLWYPAWPRKTIVIDPQRAFGRPLSGDVPADSLAAAACAENSAEIAACWYGVPKEAVDAAVEWEKRLAA
ncbi:MAG TPA: hypothetical protein VG274_03445 [Rhizomicrobium sp.]|nr:hypothetical protein [Rhizomicrobium sp.]